MSHFIRFYRFYLFNHKSEVKKTARSFLAYGRISGMLVSVAEGQVFWIPKKDFLEKDLAPGMNAVVRLNVGIVLLGKSFFKRKQNELKTGRDFPNNKILNGN